VLSQPVLEVRELDGARLNQEPGRESADPVVMDAKRFGYIPMLAHSGLNTFSGFFDSFFNSSITVSDAFFRWIYAGIPLDIVGRVFFLDRLLFRRFGFCRGFVFSDAHAGYFFEPTGKTSVVPHSVKCGQTDPDIQKIPVLVEIPIQRC
jgi:hypothetical protein